MKRSLLLHQIHSLLVASVACAIPAVCHAEPAAAGASATTDQDNTQVRALFRQGVAAFNSGHNEEAVNTLSQAWQIRQTYDVAAALAQAEMALKHYRDAAEHLDFCLSHFAPIESEQTLQQIRGAFAEVKLHVGALKIAVDHNGAEVEVDGRAVGTSPLASLAFVDPGTHSVVARLAGDQVIQSVHADPGEEVRVEMKVGAAKPVAAVGSGLPPAEPAASNQPDIAPVIVGAAVFSIGLASAVGFELAASSQADTANSLSSRIGPSGCTTGAASASDCAALHDAQKSKDRDHNWATAGFVLAGAALVATPLYWFWPRSNSGTSEAGVPPLVLRASANPTGANVWISGKF